MITYEFLTTEKEFTVVYIIEERMRLFFLSKCVIWNYSLPILPNSVTTLFFNTASSVLEYFFTLGEGLAKESLCTYIFSKLRVFFLEENYLRFTSHQHVYIISISLRKTTTIST